MKFELAFAKVLGIEGGYTNDAKDSGGATNFGITEATAREHGYTGDMRDLPLELAQRIYRVDFWDKLQLDAVAGMSWPIALELFDTGVNTGVGAAGRYLQRALNALNREQADYPDVEVDGAPGAKTVEALRAYLAKRGTAGEMVMLKALNCLQGAGYIELAERRSKDEAFLFGWLSNRVAIA